MNIYIKPTERCNLHCFHCYNYLPKVQNKKELSLAKQANTVTTLLKMFGQSQENWCILHGGEPLLNTSYDDFNALWGKVLDSGCKCQWRITTNLCLPITAERLHILWQIREVRTSFDIGIRFGSFKNLLLWYNNVNDLRRTGLHLSVSICLTKLLLKKDPVKVLDMVYKLGFESVLFEPLSLSGSLKMHQDLIPDGEEIDDWLCRFYECYKIYYGSPISNSDDVYALNPLKDIPAPKVLNFEDIKLGLSSKRYKMFNGEKAHANPYLIGQGHRDYYNCCPNTMTVNANGSVGKCPNCSRRKENTTPEFIKRLSVCQACDHYGQCAGGCPEHYWKDGKCLYPKKLAAVIEQDWLNMGKEPV